MRWQPFTYFKIVFAVVFMLAGMRGLLRSKDCRCSAGQNRKGTWGNWLEIHIYIQVAGHKLVAMVL